MREVIVHFCQAPKIKALQSTGALCGKPLTQPVKAGRTRLYCSKTCSVRAYRYHRAYKESMLHRQFTDAIGITNPEIPSSVASPDESPLSKWVRV